MPAAIFENVTLVARCRNYFQGWLAFFWITEISPTRGFLAHNNSLAARLSNGVVTASSCALLRISWNKVIWGLGHCTVGIFFSDLKWAEHRLAHVFAVWCSRWTCTPQKQKPRDLGFETWVSRDLTQLAPVPPRQIWRNLPLYHLVKCLLPLCHALCVRKEKLMMIALIT